MCSNPNTCKTCRVKPIRQQKYYKRLQEQLQSQQADDLYNVWLALAHQKYTQLRAVELTSSEHTEKVTVILKIDYVTTNFKTVLKIL